MKRLPVKLREVTARLPTAGRIRAGKLVQGPRGPRPTSLTTFRFTSQDQASIEKVAQLYGGRVEPWSHPLAAKGQWQVETDATEIEVTLPPDPLGESWYELWTAAGCQRRCDGEKVWMAKGAGPDGAEPIEQACICWQRQQLECKRTTRLSVLLPEVRFLGCWRLDSKGEAAAEELPGMVSMVQAMQGRGLTKAVLRLDQRKIGPNEFVVPMLGFDQSLNELEQATAPEVSQLNPACPGCLSEFSMHREDCPYRPFEVDDLEVIEIGQGGPVDAVIDTGGNAVIGEDVLVRRPIDEALTKAWLDSLSNAQRARALLVANQISMERGTGAVAKFEHIDLELADLVEEAMRKDT